jgi:hypothetical protein
MAKEIIAARVGDRVRVATKDGVRTGVIVRFDYATFPGKVFVQDDHKTLHEVQIQIGLLDEQ